MDYGNARAREVAAAVGLANGRLISWSKSGYRRAHPDHLPVFNGTLTDADGAGLWWGDLDLTIDEPKLLAMAALLGTTIHVLYEGDSQRVEPERWVFDTGRAALTISQEGEVVVPERLSSLVVRDDEGRLVKTSE